MPTVQETLSSIGFPFPNEVIMAFIGGSTLTGTRVGVSAGEGASDTDWFGVFIPPMDVTFHWWEKWEKWKRKEEDLDVALYSLQEWASRAAQGDLNLVHFLFAQIVETKWVWRNLILPNRSLFLAKSHITTILARASALMETAPGAGQSRSRTEYDNKRRYTSIRLLSEGKELISTGHITYPRPERELLLEIRRGKYSPEVLRDMTEQLTVECLRAKEKSPLPNQVDRDAISKLVAECYATHWELARVKVGSNHSIDSVHSPG